MLGCIVRVPRIFQYYRGLWNWKFLVAGTHINTGTGEDVRNPVKDLNLARAQFICASQQLGRFPVYTKARRGGPFTYVALHDFYGKTWSKIR